MKRDSGIGAPATVAEAHMEDQADFIRRLLYVAPRSRRLT
jgi:hypothetical protein